MKVLMLGRLGLLKGGGGDFVQIDNTAKELRKLGIEVDIKEGLNVDVKPYGIVHIFQLDWNAENYFYAKKAKKYNKPIVLSPIHHSVEEVKKFDDTYVFDYRRITKYLFKKQFHRDVYKNVYRTLFDPKKFKPLVFSIIYGLENLHQQVLKMSDVVLVQTKKEAEDLIKTYGVPVKWKLVLNGVSEQFLNIDKFQLKNPVNFTDYILCVGRIEPRKNQLSILEAVKRLRQETGLDTHLVFIGRKTFINHIEYNLRFSHEIKKYKWVSHVCSVSYKDMPSYYHFAKVGVSASWFETTGLTSLEALFCGTNAVAAGDRAKEYLGNIVSYCEPDKIDSIKEAIKKEYFAPRPKITEKMRKEYTWKNAAAQTLAVYEDILKS